MKDPHPIFKQIDDFLDPEIVDIAPVETGRHFTAFDTHIAEHAAERADFYKDMEREQDCE